VLIFVHARNGLQWNVKVVIFLSCSDCSVAAPPLSHPLCVICAKFIEPANIFM